MKTVWSVTFVFKLVPSGTPTFTVGNQDPTDGHVDVTVSGVPDGTKVTLPGVNGEKVVTGGKVTLTNNELPETPQTGKGSAKEEGKLPKEGTSDITIPGKLTSAKKDFEPVKPTEKVTVKDKAHLTPEEKKQVEDKVKDKNPGKNVTVGDDGTATVTDPTTGISHTIPGTDLVIEFAKGNPTRLEVQGLIITKWVDEEGHDLKPADAKAPSVPGEANEAFEHGEIEGYVFVRTETKGDVVTHIFRKVSPARPTGDGQQSPATPSGDTNHRPDIATPAEVPATQPTEQPSQTVEVPAQLPNEVSETDSSVSQPQAVLPNTGTQEDRATGAFGLLSLLGAFGLLFAKKKKDDEEEA